MVLLITKRKPVIETITGVNSSSLRYQCCGAVGFRVRQLLSLSHCRSPSASSRAETQSRCAPRDNTLGLYPFMHLQMQWALPLQMLVGTQTLHRWVSRRFTPQTTYSSHREPWHSRALQHYTCLSQRDKKS